MMTVAAEVERGLRLAVCEIEVQVGSGCEVLLVAGLEVVGW